MYIVHVKYTCTCIPCVLVCRGVGLHRGDEGRGARPGAQGAASQGKRGSHDLHHGRLEGNPPLPAQGGEEGPSAPTGRELQMCLHQSGFANNVESIFAMEWLCHAVVCVCVCAGS